MRLLVTRPEPDASATAGRLRALGHEALVYPLLSVEFAEPPPTPQPAALMFTSRNGVRAVERWPAAVAWLDLPVFTVGDATAAVAEAAGFRRVKSAGGDWRALADLVIAHLPADSGALLYPAGADRTLGIEARLSAAGFDLCVVEAYRMPVAKSLPIPVRRRLREGTLDGVLLYSTRTAAVFHELVAGEDALARNVVLYVISAQAAAALAGLGSPLRVAERPDEDSLLALLDQGS